MSELPPVLIIEDDHEIRILLKAILTRASLPVRLCSGWEARRCIESERFSAILLDVWREERGEPLLRWIAEQHPGALGAVIVTTAAVADSTLMQRVREIRPFAIVTKPFDIGLLVAQVRDCIARRFGAAAVLPSAADDPRPQDSPMES